MQPILIPSHNLSKLPSQLSYKPASYNVKTAFEARGILGSFEKPEWYMSWINVHELCL